MTPERSAAGVAALLLVGAGVLFWLSVYVPAGLLVLVALAILALFRSPRRSFDGPPELVVAAADGQVVKIDVVVSSSTGLGRCRRIETLIGPFDVSRHLCPTEGEITVSEATTPSTPDGRNGRREHLTLLRRDEGDVVAVVERPRFPRWLRPAVLPAGARVQHAQPLASAPFGGSVDVLLPLTYEVLVGRGDKVQAGTSPIAMPTDPSTPPPVDLFEMNRRNDPASETDAQERSW